MDAIELASVDSEQWRALQGDEPHPWGGGQAEQLSWAEKQRYVGVQGEDGELLATGGVLVAEVSAGGGEPFRVAGIGGVIVRPDMRGQGLARIVVAAILEMGRGLGPAHAMLFCREPLVPLYERFDFRTIDASVSAAQPGGRIEMQMRSMWAPLRGDASWPDGPVEVLGEPF